MNIHDWPIVRKLGVLLAFNTALAMLAIVAVFILGSAYTRHRDMEQQLNAMAQVIGENSRAAIAFNDPGGAQSVLRALQAQEEIRTVTLFDQLENRFVHLDFLASRTPSDTPPKAVMSW